MKRCIIIISLLFNQINLIGQIQVYVFDNDSFPIFQSDIILGNKRISQTNLQGISVIDLPLNLYDSLKISHPDFDTAIIAIQNFKLYRVFLQRRMFILDEVKIVDYSSILKQALDKRNPHYVHDENLYEVITYGIKKNDVKLKAHYYLNIKSNSEKFFDFNFNSFYVENYSEDKYFSTYFKDFFWINNFYHQNRLVKEIFINKKEYKYKVGKETVEGRNAYRFTIYNRKNNIQHSSVWIDVEKKAILQFTKINDKSRPSKVVFSYHNDNFILKKIEWASFDGENEYFSFFTYRPDLDSNNVKLNYHVPRFGYFSLSSEQKLKAFKEKDHSYWEKYDRFFSTNLKIMDSKVKILDFFTIWCGPCKRMDKQVLATDTIKKSLMNRFDLIKLDAEKDTGLDLAKKFRVNSYPTYIFLNKEGNEVHRFVGFRDKNQFLKELEFVWQRIYFQDTSQLFKSDLDTLRSYIIRSIQKDSLFEKMANLYIKELNSNNYFAVKDSEVIEKILTYNDSLFSSKFLNLSKIKFNEDILPELKKYFYKNYRKFAENAILESDSIMLKKINDFAEYELFDNSIKKNISKLSIIVQKKWDVFIDSLENSMNKLALIVMDSSQKAYNKLSIELDSKADQEDISLDTLLKVEDYLPLYLKMKLEDIINLELDAKIALKLLKMIEKYTKNESRINFDVIKAVLFLYINKTNDANVIYQRIKDNDLYQLEYGFDVLEEKLNP